MFSMSDIFTPQVLAEIIINVTVALVVIVGISKGLIGRKAIRARLLKEQAEKAKSVSA